MSRVAPGFFSLLRVLVFVVVIVLVVFFSVFGLFLVVERIVLILGANGSADVAN